METKPVFSTYSIYSKFQSTFFKEYPNTPCVYCGKLLYKDKATWIQYSPSSDLYPIEESNEISVLTYATIRCGILKIPTCFSCPRPRNRLQFPILAKIPEEIEALPLHRKKFLCFNCS